MNGLKLTPFRQIIGQETAKKILLRSYEKNHLASTYLFYGPDGVGKWPTAIALAALLNCEQPIRNEAGKMADACGECTNCKQILNLTFSELFFALPLPPYKSETEAIELLTEYRELKREEPYGIIISNKTTSISIKTARDIKRKAIIKPPEGLVRIIIVYQMEKMLASSADSLLKLIEEPPPYTVIILTSKNPDNLLPTIQSRSQRIHFQHIRPNLIADYLQHRYDINVEKAELIARLAEGSLGRAINMVKNEDDLPERQVAFLMFKALIQKDTPSAVATINDLYNPRDRGEVEEILRYWQSFFADIIQIKYGKQPDNMIHLDLRKELEILSGSVTENDYFSEFVNNFGGIIKSFRRNVHMRLAMTSLIIRLRMAINQSA